jgi:hypothetical protein
MQKVRITTVASSHGRWASGLLLALGCVSGCAEIEKATPDEAKALATARAELDKVGELDKYAGKVKEALIKANKDPDSIDDYANPEAGRKRLEEQPAFQEIWQPYRQRREAELTKQYLDRAAVVVRECTAVAKAGATAGEVDGCMGKTPPAKLDPVKAVGFAVLVLVLGAVVVVGYRATRRNLDAVAKAGQQLGLTVTQARDKTTITGEYKGFALKIESSPPEAGEGDVFVRVLVLSKVDPKAVVRFGPLAPPTGLDLPDLDAPEVHDERVPEGYKMRLSSGTDGEPLLSGDIGFQLRAFDPADIRVHDGMAALTCWQALAGPEKVTEFVDLAVAVARQYGKAA